MFTLGFTPELVRPIVRSQQQELLKTARQIRPVSSHIWGRHTAKYPIRVNIGKALVAIGEKLQEPYSANAWDLSTQA